MLPDLFREGKSVVVDGTFDPTSKLFTAYEVLAKHDENYMPEAIRKMVNEQQKEKAEKEGEVREATGTTQ